MLPGCISILHLALVLQQFNDNTLICLRVSKHFLIIRDLSQFTADNGEENNGFLIHKGGFVNGSNLNGIKDNHSVDLY